MASIRRQRNRIEIRECVTTARGPRQRALVSFTGSLTPELLDRAEARATRPFDRHALRERARELGVPVALRRRDPEARALLAKLRRGGHLDPGLVGLLRSELAALDASPTPEHLEDAVDWIGQSEQERGRALRGLLRTADRILTSRKAVRERPRQPYPRFASRPRLASVRRGDSDPRDAPES